ncbi:group III truncated hemoglobin [Polaribacter tangerinus]|uniref:group III truncated hemoglobin n=1 Tax=Polaribacter tangerinus TaxID=1920034 RepID=UPI000B4ABD3B|nr:group III truncated hemoglobin [Polaribacter tangerinus]
MKKDIATRADIKMILQQFYDSLLLDEKMIPFFEDILKENSLEQHLEVITDFWSDILLGTKLYKNNTMQKHLDKNRSVKFEKEHFKIWTSYLHKTIEKSFEGNLAERMKQSATSIASVMQIKMNLFAK